MGTVVFIPGLQGRAALKYAFTTAIGPNEAAVRAAAKEAEWNFAKLDYQDCKVKEPTHARMEIRVAKQLERVIAEANGEAVAIVASSVGFSVLVGALSRLKNSTSPLALIGFKPLPDALKAIELQINNPQAVEAIKSADLKSINMPVESAEGTKDIFQLRAKHLNDRKAHRILTRESDAAAFNAAVDNLQIREINMIHGTKDHLTPLSHIQAFRDSVHAVQARLLPFDGTHASDSTEMLHMTTSLMIARLG